MDPKINLDFLLSNKASYKAIEWLFNKNYVDGKIVQDYTEVFLKDLKDPELEEKLIETLLLESHDTYAIKDSLSKINEHLKREFFPKKLTNELLILLFGWLLEKQINFDDPLNFRETAFEILKDLEFPQTEVDYFLSVFLLEDIKDSLEKYLKIKNEQNQTETPFEN